mgnify:FL=1|tara:strand:+ start:415 stop:975 length:561 start_codon:yes stop_codon:yes gene_type:complete
MKYKVLASDFVKRQTKESGKTYAETMTFNEIAKIAENSLNTGNFIQGYRDGVVLIQLDSDAKNDFICPLVEINEDTKLSAKCVKRREGEENYIQIRALNGESLKTDKVDLVLYRKDVLEETNEQSTDGDWELIAFMAKPKNVKMPMGPVTMMRNQLQKPGGTKGTYATEQWADSVDFWQRFAILER